MTLRQGLLAWIGASALFMAVGAFGPWLKALAFSVSGTDGSNDGWIVLAAAVGGALFAFVGRESEFGGLWAVLAGALATATTIYDRVHISHKIDQGGTLVRELASVGWGLNLDLVASISLAVAGSVWLLSRPAETPDSSGATTSTASGAAPPAATMSPAPPAATMSPAPPAATMSPAPPTEEPLYRRDPATGEFLRLQAPPATESSE